MLFQKLNYREKLRRIVVLMGLCVSVFCLTMTEPIIASNKYLDSYDALEASCDEKFKYDGSQWDMNHESYEEYKLWNKELKRDVKVIKKTLSKEESENLDIAQKKWRKKRKKIAEKDAEGWTGGSGYILIYNMSMIKTTKKRIKHLVSKYL